ncbi:MAG: hypothetical protein ABI199_11525 [Bacteroidia bacterium]
MLFQEKKCGLITLSVAAFTMILFSCNSGNNNVNKSGKDSLSTSHKDTTAEIKTDSDSYVLPSPLQIASLFKRSGLTYVEGLTNPQKDISKYTSKFSQCIALGVYSGDLSYYVLNKKTQEAMNTMKVSEQLAGELGMSSIYEQNDLGKRFEKNISNEDSLASIISDLQMESDSYLSDNNQQHVSAIVFAGAWVETMYIGANVYHKSKNSDINNKISEQMTILGNIIQVLTKYESKDTGIAPLVAQLQSVETIYNTTDAVKNHKSDDESVVLLTEQNINDIAKKIEEIRTSFIKG